MTTLEQLGRELSVCNINLEESRVNTLLCQMIHFIIEKEYLFLLDFVYPWELIDCSCGVEKASLVIAKEPAIEGFYLLKSIPMSEILSGHIDTPLSEISLFERYSYLKNLYFLIPVME